MIAIPGTSVSMVPPHGFELSSDFTGFAHPENRASILVSELPLDAHEELSTLFFDVEKVKAAMAKQMVVVDSVERLQAANGEAVPLIRGTQKVDGQVYDKWVAVFGGSATAIVTLQVPVEVALEDHVAKAAFASVRIGSAKSLDEQIAALSFEVAIAPPFRPTFTIGGMSLGMTVGEKDPSPENPQPVLLVIYNVTAKEVADLGVAAEAQLKSLGIENARVNARQSLTLAGVNGILLEGDFTKDGRARGFAQYLAVGEDGRVLLLLADADVRQFDELRSAIAQIALSLKFKEET
jgi:hypothetical protein